LSKLKYKIMKKYNVYDYNDIAIFAIKNGYSITGFGEECIGTNFLLLKSYNDDKVISFVLTGANSSTYFYECIYLFQEGYSDYE